MFIKIESFSHFILLTVTAYVRSSIGQYWVGIQLYALLLAYSVFKFKRKTNNIKYL